MLTPPLTSLLFVLGSLLQAPSAEKPWQFEERRGNIDVYAQFPLDVAAFWSNIDEVREELDALLGVVSTGAPIEIVLFRDHASYLAYLTPRFPQARQRKALYFRNGDVSQIYAWQSRTLMTDVRHEMAHALLHQHLPFLPLWLDEGLAEYVEERVGVREASGRSRTTRWKARTGWRPSLTSLESIAAATDMDADHYRDSWAWTCFLLNDSPESRRVLRGYLDRIHKGEAPGAFSLFAEGQSPGVLSRANSYFRKITIRVASDSSRER